MRRGEPARGEIEKPWCCIETEYGRFYIGDTPGRSCWVGAKPPVKHTSRLADDIKYAPGLCHMRSASPLKAGRYKMDPVPRSLRDQYQIGTPLDVSLQREVHRILTMVRSQAREENEEKGCRGAVSADLRGFRHTSTQSCVT